MVLFRRKGKSETMRTDRMEKESNIPQYSFRRNRTLTGSTSRNVASSNELNAELASPRAHAHALTHTRRKITLFLLCMLLLASLLYILLSQLVASTTISIKNIPALSMSEQQPYRRTIDEYYAARPTERLRSLLDEQAFLLHIQATHPEVRAVRLIPSATFGSVEVLLFAREPIARWSITDGRQYVDETGTVFQVNYHESPSLRIIDNGGVSSSSSRILASNRFLGFVGQAAGYADANGYPLQQAIIPAQTTRQVELRVKGNKGRYILSVDREAGEQVEDMVRVIRYAKRKDISPQYVDLRVQGKAFYR